MAQTNFTPILTYKSDTATSVPSASNLTNSANGAELAVNTADKRLFTKDSGGNVVEVGTNPSSLTMPNGTANGVVYANGSKVLTSGSALTFDGTSFKNIGPTNALIGAYSANNASSQFVLGNSAGTAHWSFYETIGASGQQGTFNLYDNVAASLRLTVDTSGNVGIGTSSPSTKLTVYDATTPQVTFNNGTSTFIVGNNSGGNNKILYGTGAYPMIFYTNATEAMRIDASQNLGLGVTPSAWGSNRTAIQLGGSSGSNFVGGVTTALKANNYFGSADTYVANGFANAYLMNNGTHAWLNAPSGTAGNPITFTQAMTLDASGYLMVGTTTSNSAKLTLSNAGAESIQFYPASATNNNQTLHYNRSTSTYCTNGMYAADHRFFIGGSEVSRIDSSGNLLVGTTTNTLGGGSRINAQVSNTLYTYTSNQTGSGGKYHFQFADNGTSVGSITSSGSVTSYNITSDQRLKENIADAESASSLIDSLQVRQFDWKTDGLHQRYGFVAQELATVAPEAVHQPEDTEKMMAVDYSKLVPMLVKEIQSLRKRLADAGIA